MAFNESTRLRQSLESIPTGAELDEERLIALEALASGAPRPVSLNSTTLLALLREATQARQLREEHAAFPWLVRLHAQELAMKLAFGPQDD